VHVLVIVCLSSQARLYTAQRSAALLLRTSKLVVVVCYRRKNAQLLVRACGAFKHAQDKASHTAHACLVSAIQVYANGKMSKHIGELGVGDSLEIKVRLHNGSVCPAAHVCCVAAHAACLPPIPVRCASALPPTVLCDLCFALRARCNTSIHPSILTAFVSVAYQHSCRLC
jgi:hypothetical protein